MSGLLLHTKLFKPAPRPSLIARQHLIHRLNEGLGHGAEGFIARLTLVSAPAGYGKTTLVAVWLAQLAAFNGLETAWLSVDEGDNDVVRFLDYLIAALQTAVPQMGQAAARALQSPQPPAAETVLTLLLNEMSQHARPVVLVLDDYHTISSPTVHGALAYLLDHLPSYLHLLISTRSDPPLPLSRLRARSQLTEMRAGDLRFMPEESGLFFTEVMGLALTEDEVAALEQRTEGWVAGLQLAALSLQGRADRRERITAFSGSHHFVIDYLTEEVLAQQPAEVRNFLLCTSILERVCGPLANALTQSDTGQETLEYLEHSNLFLTPLDQERCWYRYHHLFAEVLQARLLQSQQEQLRKLHRRAAMWHVGRGMIEGAVHHAVAGGDFEEAATLIEGVAGELLHQGGSASLIRWLDALPEETVRARPRLCLARGWTFVWGQTLNLELAELWAQLALQAVPAGQSLERSLQGEVAALQAMTAATWNDDARSIELARQALAYLPSDSSWRGVMNFCVGSGYYASGDLAAASDFLEKALRLSEADGVHYIQLIVASFLADIYGFQGRLGRAGGLYQQVLTWADKAVPQKGVVMAHGGLAYILCERNQLDAALVHLRLGAEQLPQVGGIWPSRAIYRALARVRQAEGAWTEALAALDQASRDAESTQKGLIVTEIAALRARLQLAQGDLAAAEAWVAHSGLGGEDRDVGSGGLHEEAYLTLARVVNAQGKHGVALSLLDRLMQSAEGEGRQGSLVAILVLQALVNQAQGDRRFAVECLERALVLAEPEGYCRVFVDEGRPMADLLRQARQRGRMVDYIDRLLGAFAAERSIRPAEDSLPEALSERELEVLRLAATGASNKEIGETLFIALPTVKKHMGHILVKLDTHNRVQAIARARELGLLF